MLIPTPIECPWANYDIFTGLTKRMAMPRPWPSVPPIIPIFILLRPLLVLNNLLFKSTFSPPNRVICFIWSFFHYNAWSIKK